jgi:hypothetical protein
MTRTTLALPGLWTLIVLGTLAVPGAAQDGTPGLIRPPATAAQATGEYLGAQPATPVCDSCDSNQHALGGRLLGSHPLLPGRGHGHGVGACAGCATGAWGHGTGAHRRCQPLIDPHAQADWIAANQAAVRSWHAGYYNTQYGTPVALVVPPHARMQTRWGWGVSQSTMSPIYHQFERPYPGPVMVDEATGMGPGPLLPTPRWPSHTDQFGVYYVRGPW